MSGLLAKAVLVLMIVAVSAAVVSRFLLPLLAVLGVVIVLRIVWHRTGW